jgi:hypothetical protein
MTKYYSQNPRGKRSVVLGLAILGAMLEDHPFQFTCSEGICLKTDGHFQNVGVLHPAGIIDHWAIMALCGVLTHPDMNSLS